MGYVVDYKSPGELKKMMAEEYEDRFSHSDKNRPAQIDLIRIFS